MNKLGIGLGILAMFALLFSLANASTWKVPSGAVKSINISLNNLQSSPITAGTQVMVPFNGLAYQSYFNGNLINLEVFNGLTGNILYTYFEGNILNENQEAGFNGVQNDILWVTLPTQIAASTNAVNVMSIALLGMGTTALNGNNMGIAPQIFCASGCPQSSYGQYDNGANVFVMYQNFAGTSATGWTKAGTGLTWNNGLSWTTTTVGASSITTTGTWGQTPSQILDTLFRSDVLACTACVQIGYTDAPQHNFVAFYNNPPILADIESGGAGFQQASTGIGGDGAWHPVSIYWGTSSAESWQTAYGTSLSETWLSPSATPIGLSVYAGATGSGAVDWIRVRTYPPFGVQPGIIFGSLQGTITSASLSLSNTMIDQGQGILFATSTGLVPPISYAFNIYTYNSGSSSTVLLANQLYTANAYTSNTWFWKPAGNLYMGNSLFFANVVVFNSVSSQNTLPLYLGYNSAPTVNVNTITNTILTLSQTTTFTVGETGGTGQFQAELYNITGTAQQGSNRLITSVGGTNTLSFVSGTQDGQFTYNWILTDKGTTTPFVFSSYSNSIIVGELVTISPLFNTTHIGYLQTLLATVQGGTPSYTYNWIVTNSVGQVFNALYVGNTIASNTFTFVPVAPDTYTINVVVTDSSSPTPIVAGSVNATDYAHAAIVSQAVSVAYSCARIYNPATNDIVQLKNLSGSTIQQTQIVNPNFLVYMPFANLPYTLSILYANLTQIPSQSQQFVPSSQTIDLFLPCLNNVVPVEPFPQISTSCKVTSYFTNSIANCNGNDYADLVSGWTVLILNYSNPLGYPFVVNSQTFAGNYFTGNWYLPGNNVGYYAKVIANTTFTANTGNAIYAYGFYLPATNKPLLPNTGYYNWLVALTLILIPLVVAYYNRTACLIILGFDIWVGSILGAFPFGLAVDGAITVCIVVIIIIDERN